MSFKIGFGYDVHRLERGRPFWLGGIRIDSEKGAVGHSDADVLIHSICDAILGAAGLGDIGRHFPNTDPKYKGIDSKILLQNVMELINKENYTISNIDSTICLQKPKIEGYIEEMKKILAPILFIDNKSLNIKATTTEKLGFTGSEEGVSAYAVVLIKPTIPKEIRFAKK